MVKTLILKTPHAQPVGYVQQGNGVVTCKRTSNDMTGTCVIHLFFAGGRRETMQVEQGDREISILERAEIEGAVLCSEDVVRASTGENALRLYEKHAWQEKIHVEDCDGHKRSEEPGSEEGTETEDTRVQAEPVCFPARRWPPPVCCSGARYVHGEWFAGGETIISGWFSE